MNEDPQKDINFRDILLLATSHEFSHGFKERENKTYSEQEIEEILGAYNEKWNVSNMIREIRTKARDLSSNFSLYLMHRT
jgi:predicted nucleic acid-binding protein